MKTLIENNGSKWAGQSPDNIETLYSVLGTDTLDPTFENYGNFTYDNQQSEWLTDEAQQKYGHFARCYFGNFYTVSHVFRIYTSDPDVIARLDSLIADNQNTDAYREARREIEAMRVAREKEAEARYIRDQWQRARAILR